jgi:protocatechuate 3,4-dioxygenase beta subunit
MDELIPSLSTLLMALAITFHTALCAGVGQAVLPDIQRFTSPPGQETDEARRLIDRAAFALRSGQAATSILTVPSFLPAHEWPRFRALIRQEIRSSRVTIVTSDEPGTPLFVSGRVLDRDNRPIPGARIYVYQTSARGWYSDRAAHFSGNEGDRRHARIFGYLTTDASGRFELRTVRPAGYPGSDLPAHIHVEVARPGGPPPALITEIQFDDDSRLTPEARRRSRLEGFVIAHVEKGPMREQLVRVDLEMR